MASQEAHISKAIHNFEVCSFLTSREHFKDWVVVTGAYAGLHIVDAVLYATQEGYQKHGQSHDKRGTILKNKKRLTKTYQCYRNLQQASVVARYMQGPKTPVSVNIDFEKYMPIDKMKALLKENLGGLIKTAGNFIDSKVIDVKFVEYLGDFLDIKISGKT